MFPVLTQPAPSDPLLYPLHAQAAELGVPMVINVGMPGPAGHAELQHPSHLDRICTDFPELRVVAAHVGAPWQAEVLWYMGKHEHLTLMTSAYAPGVTRLRCSTP